MCVIQEAAKTVLKKLRSNWRFDGNSEDVKLTAKKTEICVNLYNLLAN